jgi:hypothetical protein
MFYAGIGSRKTPNNVLSFFTTAARVLDRNGYILRSGGADGADTAFEKGTFNKEIFLPWKGFNSNNSQLYNISSEAYNIAELYHPYWDNLKESFKKFHARNVHQILGKNLDKPVKFVLCWTPDGAETMEETSKETGGTGQAIRIAWNYQIPIYNLKNDKSKKRFGKFVKEYLC